MTVRSLSLFVTRTTMLLVNIDTQTYSSECWKILIFLYDIWHYKIFSVYWTSTVHWLDLQITRFQSIAISAFRRSSRRVYFLLVGLADHCGPTSMSPCIGKNLLSSISLSRTTGWFESCHSYRLWQIFHGVVMIAENNASRHFSSVSTLWLFSSDLLLYLPSLLLFVPMLLHNYRLHLLLLSVLFERILVNKLEMINVMKPVFEKYTAAVQESTLTMYKSTHHMLSRGEYSSQFIKKCIFSRGNSLGNAWKNAFFPQDLKVPNIHDKI